jgi:acyl-CoA synthetase (AMP-forming)/AMP-acid ligase II
MPAAEDTTPALMQFTSGSTGAPRGVVLSNGNLAANCAAIVEAYGLSAATRGFSWLPLHHDMGLVGHILTPLWIGCRSTIMDPLLFLQSPLRWLRRAGEEQATITSAPNFAYQLCVREAEAGADLAGIDLSSVTAAVCGGEPVWPDTVARFCAAFEPFGFDRDAFAPSYGLAEATLLVSSGRRRGGPRVFAGQVRDPEAAEGTKDIRSVVLGRPVSGVAVRIVGPDGRSVPDGTIGEIALSGAGVGRVSGERQADAAAGVATGDLGFIHDGELVVTGRRKELMILRGANVYPADAEAAASAADPSLNPGGVAAFGMRREGTEEMMVVFEVQRGPLPPEVFDGMVRRVNEAVGKATGHVPAAVMAVPYGALPRTTSGKIRRHALADLCRRGAIAVLNATDAGLIVAKEATP